MGRSDFLRPLNPTSLKPRSSARMRMMLGASFGSVAFAAFRLKTDDPNNMERSIFFIIISMLSIDLNLLLKALLSNLGIFTLGSAFKNAGRRKLFDPSSVGCLHRLSSACLLKRPLFPLRSNLCFAFARVHILSAVRVGLAKDL